MLDKVIKEYDKYIKWGYNRGDAAKNAVDNIFKGKHVHIYKDEYGDAVKYYSLIQLIYIVGNETSN